MSQINRNVYPARPVTLTGLEITQPTLADTAYYPNDVDWDTSIAISQSTAEFAPYNIFTFFLPIDNNNQTQIDYKRKSIQKIGLYYTQELNAFGERSQTPSGNFPSGQSWDYAAWRLGYGRKSYIGGNYVDGLNPQNYFFVTGLDFSSSLCVICVRFVSNAYCSLKYYLEHKNDVLSNETPASLFMIGLFGGENTDSRQSFAPFDCEPYEFIQWSRNEQDVVTKNDTPGGKCSTKYPLLTMYSISSLSNSYAPDNKNVGGLNPRCLVFPLIGCMFGAGNQYVPNSFSDWWTGNPRQNYSSIIIVGGYNEIDYTIQIVGNAPNQKYDTVLTQAGIDNAHKVAATYGLPFADDFPDGYNNFYSQNITTYIPTANEGGYYNGTYDVLSINGVFNSNVDPDAKAIFDGGINAPYNNRTYDPDIPVSTPSIDLTEPTLTAIDAFNRTYVINRSDVDALGQIFWSADDSILTKIKKAWDLFGEKPINGVINLMLFPFDVRTKTGATTIENITFGAYDTDILAYRLPQTAQVVFDLGTFKWNFEYGDTFLDYSPYTEAELYVPFFGVFPLSNEHFIGKTIDIKLVVDYITGSATAIVYVVDRNKRHPVIYKNATIGVQVPVSGDDVQQRITAMLDNSLKVMDTVGKGVDAIAGKSIEKGVDAIGQVISPEFTPATMYQSAGSSTPENSLYLPKKPYIILYLPNPIDVSSYGHSIGFATMESVTINDCQGFSKFSNIDLTGLTATQAEQQQILNLLESGVYL